MELLVNRWLGFEVATMSEIGKNQVILMKDVATIATFPFAYNFLCIDDKVYASTFASIEYTPVLSQDKV